MWVLGTKPEFFGGVASALKHPKSSWLHYFFTFAILGSDAGPHVVGKLSPPELQPQGALYFYFQCRCVCSVKEFNGFFFKKNYLVFPGPAGLTLLIVEIKQNKAKSHLVFSIWTIMSAMYK